MRRLRNERASAVLGNIERYCSAKKGQLILLTEPAQTFRHDFTFLCFFLFSGRFSLRLASLCKITIHNKITKKQGNNTKEGPSP